MGAAKGRLTLLDDGGENVQGMGTADKALQEIIHARDIEMEHRAEHVEAKMKEMVTEPWATMHPEKLERAQKRDEMLVKQAEQQAKEDERLLQRAQSISSHDKKLVAVAQARKGLMMPSSSSSSSASSFSSSSPSSSSFATPSHPPRIPRDALKAEEGSTGRGGGGGGKMAAKFEAVHRKAVAIRRLGTKHGAVYANVADERAHHTVESLPYILPPVGVAVLLLLFAVTYSVKQWHKIPNGVSWVRRQKMQDLQGGGEGDGGEGGMEWRELDSTV